MLSGFLGF